MADISTEGTRMINADAPRRTAVAAADSAVLATFKTAHGAAFSTRDRSVLYLWGAFSAAAIVAEVEILYFAEDDDGDESTTIEPSKSNRVTLTASDVENGAGKFLSQRRVVTVDGWPKGRIRLASISAGTVDLFVGEA